jgi:16S rRNA (guanine527-N7)-methyltransferase
MEQASIAKLLRPFLRHELSGEQLAHISIYIDILLKWNVRINLTALRQPDEVVLRHFGESLFTAQRVFGGPKAGPGWPTRLAAEQELTTNVPNVVDIGSGAGFPGIPIKIYAQSVRLTLIESNHKKATFLKEVVRALSLKASQVFQGRAEDYPPKSGDIVTLRAVERFESIVPVAARLLTDGGQLVLLIGAGQIDRAKILLNDLEWFPPVPLPLSDNRVLLMGKQR